MTELEDMKTRYLNVWKEMYRLGVDSSADFRSHTALGVNVLFLDSNTERRDMDDRLRVYWLLAEI